MLVFKDKALTAQNLAISISQWAEVKMGDKSLAPPNKWKLYRLVPDTPTPPATHLAFEFREKLNKTSELFIKTRI